MYRDIILSDVTSDFTEILNGFASSLYFTPLFIKLQQLELKWFTQIVPHDGSLPNNCHCSGLQ
jgi:hypothetical protein